MYINNTVSRSSSPKLMPFVPLFLVLKYTAKSFPNFRYSLVEALQEKYELIIKVSLK